MFSWYMCTVSANVIFIWMWELNCGLEYNIVSSQYCGIVCTKLVAQNYILKLTYTVAVSN